MKSGIISQLRKDTHFLLFSATFTKELMDIIDDKKFYPHAGATKITLQTRKEDLTLTGVNQLYIMKQEVK